MINEAKNLIVVYKEKDELSVNQIKKLIETNDDDLEKGVIVGTEDGSVKIIAHNEKVYLDNKKSGKVGKWDDRILFIDDIKGVDDLIPTLDIKFDKYGVKYGFSGKQAAIIIDPRALRNKKEYQAFIDELKNICSVSTVDEKRKLNINNKKDGLKKGAIILSTQFLFGLIGTTLTISTLAIKDKKLTRKQQLLYAVTNLYLNDLEEFMKK